jgi:DNA-binding response OmpR family regulator
VAEGARDIVGFPPTILITAFGSEETHEAARRCGVVAVMDKPFAMKDLLNLVREVLSRGERHVVC